MKGLYQQIVHVLSASRRLIQDDVFLSQRRDNPGGSAPANLVIVQMEVERSDVGMDFQISLEGNRHHVLPFCLEHPGKGQQMITLPVAPAMCSMVA